MHPRTSSPDLRKLLQRARGRSLGDHERSYGRTTQLDLAEPDIPKQSTATAFRGAHNFSIRGNAHVVNVGSQKNVNFNNYSGTSDLDFLRPFVSFDALYDSSVQDPQRQCHPDTRNRVLKQMRDWIDNPSATQRILWLHGPAGVGKSAIAQTISRSCSRNIVAATFFFFRSDSNRNDGNHLFPTIAWQLAKSIPGAKDRISDRLDQDSDIPRKEIEVQFEQLIAQPLQSLAGVTSRTSPLDPVVIIDGVDECLDEKLQERLLDIVGKAMTGMGRIPLRFLISSRPEALIKDTLDQFRNAILQIDLAEADEAYADVERYLKTEFTRIALKQSLDANAWPGQRIIRDLAFRSCGQFVYASTVIKFVGDDYNSAPSQLDIILGLEPTDGKAPFADLDTLYLEILRWQREQQYLKDFLALFLAGCSRPDYALLLNVSGAGVLRKLRGMHSVLVTEPRFKIHHQSFLDFLTNSSRSRQYHTNEKTGTRRYMELIVDALVRHAPRILKQQDHHEHFSPAFGEVISTYPRKVELPLQDWEEILRPLFAIKDESLKLSNPSYPWKRGRCDECMVFFIIDDLLLHLSLLRQGTRPFTFSSLGKQRNIFFSIKTWITPKNLRQGLSSLIRNNADRKVSQALEHTQSPDHCLSTLLDNIKDGMPTYKSSATINLFRKLLCFDHAETALKVQSISDAQHLIDLIYYLISNKHILDKCGSGARFNAFKLALEIFSWVPIVPQSSLDRSSWKYCEGLEGLNTHINPACQEVLIGSTLSHDNIYPLRGAYENKAQLEIVFTKPTTTIALFQWRQLSNRSVVEMKRCMLDVAKAIQYMHSLGLVLNDRYDWARIVLLDADLHSKVLPLCLSSRYKLHGTPALAALRKVPTREGNIYMFGSLFYRVFFNAYLSASMGNGRLSRGIITQRRHEPKIDDNSWQLIQRCCDGDPMARPEIDEVVAEIRDHLFYV